MGSNQRRQMAETVTAAARNAGALVTGILAVATVALIVAAVALAVALRAGHGG